jgi:nucleoside-diphosphate-sugar epimerase
MKALVTGASGAIGASLVEQLLAHNFGVLALLRASSGREHLNSRVEIIEGEITDGESLRRAVDGVDTVFHLAAKLHVNAPSSSLRDEYRNVNVEGTRLLAEAAQAAGVERLIFFSTVNVYGASVNGELSDEASTPKPESIYAETKLEAEKIVLGTLPSVVLRLAAVYGPRMKGNYPLLVEALRKGRFVKIGDGRNRRSLVHVEDVCRAALLVGDTPKAIGETYNVTDGKVHTLNEVIDAISVALKKSPPRLRLPVGPTRALAGVLEDGAHLFGIKSPIGRNTVDKLNEDVAVSSKKIERELGFEPRVDLLTGWCKTV